MKKLIASLSALTFTLGALFVYLYLVLVPDFKNFDPNLDPDE